MANSNKTVGICVQVAIVGGGIAGLTAAYELHKSNKNLKIVVLEARDQFGGRTLSPPMKSTANGVTNNWDLGGQWVGKTQTHIQGLLKELNIETHPQYVSGTHLCILHPGGSIVKYKGDDMFGSMRGELDAWNLYRKLQDMSKHVPIENPFKYKKAEEWNMKSLQTWLLEEAWTARGQESVRMLVESAMDARIDQISLLFFLMYLNSAGSDIEVFAGDTGKGAQAFRIAGGAQRVSHELVTRLPVDTVLLNTTVNIIEHNCDNVVLHTKLGQKFKAQYAIICIPPSQMSSIKFLPFLQGIKLCQLKNYKPKGKGIKFVATYKTAFWREAGLSGQISCVEGRKDGKTGELLPSILTFDGCSHDHHAALIGFSDLTSDIPAHRRKQLNINVIKEFFGEKAESECLDYCDCAWMEEEHIGGCVATLDVGMMEKNYSDLLRLPTGRIHWGGTETATSWLGYINGAVQSGIRVAHEIPMLNFTTKPL